VLPPVTTFESKKSKNIDLVAQNIDSDAESNGIEKNKSFETIGGNTPVATPETPTAHDLEPVTTSLLPPTPTVEQDFAKKIREALTYKSPAVAEAIDYNLMSAVDAGKLTLAAVIELVGIESYQEFKSLIK
jgi:hypothetical protein